jgi:hypothetical protein
VHGDSCQRRFYTWAPSGQRADPISPGTLDASALHLVFSHLWTAAHPGRVHEEWPRFGRGSEPMMNSGGSGGGQNRPWCNTHEFIINSKCPLCNPSQSQNHCCDLHNVVGNQFQL